MQFMDSFCQDTFCCCVLENNSLDYHDDSLNVVFPWFRNCFLPFPLFFSQVSPGVYTLSLSVYPVSVSVSPVSQFKFCECFSGFFIQGLVSRGAVLPIRGDFQHFKVGSKSFLLIAGFYGHELSILIKTWTTFH